MLIYHVTDARVAAKIEAAGFVDEHGTYLSDLEHSGVWVSDSPLYGESGTADPVAFEIEIDEASLEPFEWIEDGKPHREWLAPAVLLNACTRRRLSDNELLAAFWG